MNNKVIELLEEIGVNYHTSGKNVTEGWIEVQCPYCTDPSFHLGISPNLKFNCWICGEKGTLRKLAWKLCQENRLPFLEIYPKYFKDAPVQKVSEQKPIVTVPFVMPSDIEADLPDIAKEYLIKRGYDPTIMIPKYGLMWGNRLSDYKFRIIIPIVQDNEMISFTARGIHGEDPKYKNFKGINIKHHLYNIDSVRKRAIIVEGPTDAWRIGDGAIATLGIEWTNAQVEIISKKKINDVILLFDGEEKAQEQAVKLARALSAFTNVEVIEPEEGLDPDKMDKSDIDNLKKWIQRGG